jgi:AraC-like DNA-binding protein
MAKKSPNSDFPRTPPRSSIPGSMLAPAPIHQPEANNQKPASAPGITPQGLIGHWLLQLKAADWEKLAAAARWQPEALAALCSVKPRLLERLFKRQFRKAPHAWMRKLRCRRAAALIAEGWDLKNAGPALGFATASHLCHEFKKAFGVSPKRFARGVRGGRKSP